MLELINQGEVGVNKPDKSGESEPAPAKKRPGRPPKAPRAAPATQATPAIQAQFETISDNESPEKAEPAPKKRRGRPPKNKGVYNTSTAVFVG